MIYSGCWNNSQFYLDYQIRNLSSFTWSLYPYIADKIIINSKQFILEDIKMSTNKYTTLYHQHTQKDYGEW